MATKEPVFVDLDFGFAQNPLTGDVSVKTDANAINQSLKNLILTMYYERPFQSNLGSLVNQLLFEPITPILPSTLQRAIEQVIRNFEPRVSLKEINIQINSGGEGRSVEENGVFIEIYYTILQTQEIQTVNLFLERTR